MTKKKRQSKAIKHPAKPVEKKPQQEQAQAFVPPYGAWINDASKPNG